MASVECCFNATEEQDAEIQVCKGPGMGITVMFGDGEYQVWVEDSQRPKFLACLKEVARQIEEGEV